MTPDLPQLARECAEKIESLGLIRLTHGQGELHSVIFSKERAESFILAALTAATAEQKIPADKDTLRLLDVNLLDPDWQKKYDARKAERDAAMSKEATP
jgi:hypothetical protein